MSEGAEIEVQAMYSALGEFFVEFSQLLHAMELSTAFYLAGGRDSRFIYSALASRESKSIIDSFFTLCAEIGDQYWSGEDRGAIKQFRTEIEWLAAVRNRFAHDTWFVGWMSQTGDAPAVLAPSERYRTKGTKAGVEFERASVTVPEIKDRSKDAIRLRRIVGNVLSLVHAYATEHGGVELVLTRAVGDGPRSATPRISRLLQARDGRVEWVAEARYLT